MTKIEHKKQELLHISENCSTFVGFLKLKVLISASRERSATKSLYGKLKEVIKFRRWRELLKLKVES